MLDKEFCDFLEYHLTKSFKHSADDNIRSFWCDGIALPLIEKEYSQKTVNDKRQILLKAYIGKDGQDEYKLLMKFGNRSLSNYARGLDIKEHVPDQEKNDWYSVDIKNKQITIQLN